MDMCWRQWGITGNMVPHNDKLRTRQPPLIGFAPHTPPHATITLLNGVRYNCTYSRMANTSIGWALQGLLNLYHTRSTPIPTCTEVDDITLIPLGKCVGLVPFKCQTCLLEHSRHSVCMRLSRCGRSHTKSPCKRPTTFRLGKELNHCKRSGKHCMWSPGNPPSSARAPSKGGGHTGGANSETQPWSVWLHQN